MKIAVAGRKGGAGKIILATNLACFIFLLTLPGFTQEKQSGDFQEVDVHEFFIQMNLVENEVLIDVREYKEYRKVRIPHAILAPNSSELFRLADTLDFEQPLFVYCDDSNRSTTACALLVEMGFEKVYLLRDGLIAWKKRELHVDIKKLRRKRR
ncbi:Thiosulfate sulfurtransferase GlpE [subsurface metagenome]